MQKSVVRVKYIGGSDIFSLLKITLDLIWKIILDRLLISQKILWILSSG